MRKLAFLAVPLALAGCGGGAVSLGPAPKQSTTVEATPNSQTKSTKVTATPTSSGSVLPLAVWFVRGDRLERSISLHVKTARVATAALTDLLSGPSKAVRRAGTRTAIPAGTQLLGISIDHGVATVDLSSQFQSGGNSRSLQLRLAQVVYTVTEFPTVSRVRFELDGSPVNVFSSEGIVLDHPVGRKDYRAFLPFSGLLGNWRLVPRSPITPDFDSATAVWTGTEMLAFGRDTITALDANGNPYAVETRNVAAAYVPGGGWRRLTPPQSSGTAPSRDTAVWTGTELLVWGSNLAYDPAANRWRRLPAPPAGGGLVAWTGKEMIGWGGGCCGDASNDGAAYDPATNTWRKLAHSPLPGSQHPIGAWTGKELIVVVGGGQAAAYEPAQDAWRSITPLPQSNVLVGGASAVWDGKELLVGGTSAAHHRRISGGFAYDPATNLWRRLPPAPIGRSGAAAVWAGTRMLLWGGGSSGTAYAPVADEWSSLPPAPLPAKLEATAVWTGRSMIVWGGVRTKTWGKYDPAGAIFTPGASA
jgi:spore germination protein GerM